MPPEPVEQPSGGDPLLSELPPLPAAQERPRTGPIGVPDYTRMPDGSEVPFAAPRLRPVGPSDSFEAAAGRRTGGPVGQRLDLVEPKYWTGHEITLFAGLSFEEKARLQLGLEDAGLLKKGKYLPGRWDAASQGAAAAMLGYANANGYEWGEALEDLQAAKAAQGDVNAYIPKAWLPPDPERAADDISKAAAAVIGRALDDDEIEAMRAQYLALDRQQHDAEQAVAGSEMTRGQAIEGEGDYQPPALESEVDRDARLKALIEERYAPEVARNQLVAEGVEGRKSLMESIFGMDRAIGGA